MPLYTWLGVRLTLADRRTRRALALLTAVSAVVCMAVLASAGAQSVVQHDREIQAWRTVIGDRTQTAGMDSGIWLTSASTYPTGTGSELTVLTIAAEQSGAVLNWPGLTEFPPSETVMVSPAVAAAKGDAATVIAEYVATPGVDVGALLADEWLRTGSELLAVKFIAGPEVTPSPEWKPLEIGSVRQAAETPSYIVVALLLTFFASATLLISVAARFIHRNELNLAAIRLQGASRPGVAVVALVPIVVAAIVGSLVGAMFVWLSTSVGSGVAPRSIALVLDRAQVPLPHMLGGMAGVVAVVALMGMASIALVARDSLAVSRSAEPRPRRLPVVRLVLLVVGIALLTVDAESDRGALVWWIGTALFLVGVLALGRLLLAFFANRQWTQPPQILGFGILGGASREAKLLYAPTLSILFACALLVPLSSGLMYEDELSQAAHADVIVTDMNGGLGRLGDARAELEREAPWLDTGLVANLRLEVRASDPVEGGSGRRGWVGGCADLKLFLGTSALECESGVAYFPPGLEPADSTVEWQTHDLDSNLIYWANPRWAETSAEAVALAWLAVSTGDRPTTEAVATISQRFPGLRVEVPDEYRETQRQDGQFQRTLVLLAVVVIALAALGTFIAAASHYLTRRTPYLEHVLRMGLTKGALFSSAAIVIVLPLIVGGLLVVPSGIIIGLIMADGATSIGHFLAVALAMSCSVGLGVMAAWIRIASLDVRAPHRSLGGGGLAGRG